MEHTNIYLTLRSSSLHFSVLVPVSVVEILVLVPSRAFGSMNKRRYSLCLLWLLSW